MVRTLYGLGVLALMAAGVPCVLCATQWRHDGAWASDMSRVDLAKQVHANARGARGQGAVVSPLIAEATAFALYLDPPKPPPPPQAQPRLSVPQPAPRPVAIAPQFRLLSTSCPVSQPEKSLALISEPGRGERWVRKGDPLGHLVVESIRDGTLVYRDGAALREVSVIMRQTVELARAIPGAASSPQIAGPDMRLVNAAGTNEPERKAANDQTAKFERQ